MEHCHYCCFDFIEMNNEARAEATMKKAVRPAGTSLGPGLLRSGTEVRMPDRSGNVPPNPLDGRVVGTGIDEDPDSDFEGMECYVIQYGEGFKHSMKYPTEWVHEEWLVKDAGRWVPAETFVNTL
ncbi:hypothetical protein HK104_008361 [Borealophlyctis nickersoniae]|nr:hypothetical protein HK104_008361 [Borealophlyctis nickersoniae]